jgi:hypothetical protein
MLCLGSVGDVEVRSHTLDMPRRPIARPHPLSAQQRTIAAVSAAKVKENKQKADELQTKVTSLESDPFFVTIDGGGPVLDDTDIFDGGQVDA